jgi:hypothetical protein
VSFFETAGYWEIPLGPNDSFVAAPWLEQNYDTLEGWRGEATFGFKHALWRGRDSIVSLQAGALWMSFPGAGCGEGGAELRLLGGMNFGSGSFLNAEAAGRALEGGCSGERFDLTLGHRPNERWLVMGQVFMESYGQSEDSVDGQFSLVRFGDDGNGVQVGLRARLDGAVEEIALVLGFWGRPGD